MTERGEFLKSSDRRKPEAEFLAAKYSALRIYWQNINGVENAPRRSWDRRDVACYSVPSRSDNQYNKRIATVHRASCNDVCLAMRSQNILIKVETPWQSGKGMDGQGVATTPTCYRPREERERICWSRRSADRETKTTDIQGSESE